ITTMAAPPMVTPSSAAICGSSGSHTRRLAALAKEASASTGIAPVGGGAAVDGVELTGKPLCDWAGAEGPVATRRRDTCRAGGLLLADAALAVATGAGGVVRGVV